MILFSLFINSLLADRVSRPANSAATRSINPECPDEQAALACEDDCFFEQYTCLSQCSSDDRDCITACNREYTKVSNSAVKNNAFGSVRNRICLSIVFYSCLVPWSLSMLHWMLLWVPLSVWIAILLRMWGQEWKWIHGLQIKNSLYNGWLYWRLWTVQWILRYWLLHWLSQSNQGSLTEVFPSNTLDFSHVLAWIIVNLDVLVTIITIIAHFIQRQPHQLLQQQLLQYLVMTT